MKSICHSQSAPRVCAAIAALSVLMLSAAPAAAQWTQFGGPNQDFKCDAKHLTDAWPEDGPRRLWQRDLGEGYSGILFDRGTLFTMCRNDGQEAVVALSADTGSSLWEHKYDVTLPKSHAKQFGQGPRGAPLVYKGRVYSIGVSGMMHCLDKKSGKSKWSHDLLKEFDGTILQHGYACSPIGYKKLIFATTGGKGASVVAFDYKTGDVVWKKHDYRNSYSTPKIIKVDGQDQLICYMGSEVVGLSPKTGKLLWEYHHENQWKQNICMPVWGDDNILFITSVANGGSRGLKLTRKGDKTTVKELWANNKVKVHHSNAIRIGDHVYTSSGGRGPGILYAIDVKTGEVAWRERGFAKATLLYADGKFIVLDEDGMLGLVEATPKKLNVLAKTPLLNKPAWTVPTLIGNRLFVRDQEKILALDLS